MAFVFIGFKNCVLKIRSERKVLPDTLGRGLISGRGPKSIYFAFSSGETQTRVGEGLIHERPQISGDI